MWTTDYRETELDEKKETSFFSFFIFTRQVFVAGSFIVVDQTEINSHVLGLLGEFGSFRVMWSDWVRDLGFSGQMW